MWQSRSLLVAFTYSYLLGLAPGKDNRLTGLEIKSTLLFMDIGLTSPFGPNLNQSQKLGIINSISVRINDILIYEMEK